MRLRNAIALALIVSFAAVTAADAAPRRPKKQEEAAPAPTPPDKRDRTIAAPGTPFNGRTYWQAAAQCGGTYFKLYSLYSDAAISAKVIKPDPAAFTRLSKNADDAGAAATAFFGVSEYFLTVDRKLTREDAVMTYDPVSNTAGERLKTTDAALQATKPCLDLYKMCRGTFPQVCNDPNALTN